MSFEALIVGLGTEKAEAHIFPRSEGMGEKKWALWMMIALYERYCGLTGVGCSGRGRLAIKASTIPNMRVDRRWMDGVLLFLLFCLWGGRGQCSGCAKSEPEEKALYSVRSFTGVERASRM